MKSRKNEQREVKPKGRSLTYLGGNMFHGTSGQQSRVRPRPDGAGAEEVSLISAVDIQRALSNGNLVSRSLPPVRLGKGETAGGREFSLPRLLEETVL